MNNITIITSDKNWIESEAVEHLKKIAKYNGMKKVVGLPDLHQGKVPVGAVFITEDIIYPHLIGCDIGCGMTFSKIEIKKHKFKVDKIYKKLSQNNLFNTDSKKFLNCENEDLDNIEQLGTIGSGNHFAEFQEIFKVHDEEFFNLLNLKKDEIYLLVHSGSRKLGFDIYNEFTKKNILKYGFSKNSKEFEDYLYQHNKAVNWARLNRELIIKKLLYFIGASNFEVLVNSVHNSIETMKRGNKKLYIHRKGAAPSNAGLTTIPGTRGSLTYLVMPTDKYEDSGYSIAHGAGRKWNRTICKNRLRKNLNEKDLLNIKDYGRLICNDKDLIYEEAPQAYKNVDNVILSLVEHGLIKVIATLKPIITYKN